MELKNRPIRSFVRREGRLTSGQRRALDELWPGYGLEFSEQPVDLNTVFNRTAPRVLEIGFGNGESLVAQARRDRQLDFVGIETHRPGVGHLLRQLSREGLTNVRLWCHDAVEVLNASVADEAFVQISIFFPDPWPKKRHYKRRLLQPAVVRLLAAKLQTGGVLHLATDWADYARFAHETITGNLLFKPAGLESVLPRPQTKFEQRGVQKGHTVTDQAYRRA